MGARGPERAGSRVASRSVREQLKTLLLSQLALFWSFAIARGRPTFPGMAIRTLA
jgi:hypothetical protein